LIHEQGAAQIEKLKQQPIVMPGVSLPHLGVHLLGKEIRKLN
jgi:hypothetical protein